MNPHYLEIAKRANHRCEYCQAPEVVFNFPFEVEHVIPLSQNGTDDQFNLALACRSCNLRKGARISGFLSELSNAIRFFNPRNDKWSEHFQVVSDSGEIMGITLIGKVTVTYLDMNSNTQVAARQLWIRLGLFP